jgi:hypothetical protein
MALQTDDTLNDRLANYRTRQDKDYSRILPAKDRGEHLFMEVKRLEAHWPWITMPSPSLLLQS